MNKIRVALFILGAVSALFISPWLSAACMVALSLRYRAFEVLVIGLLIDFTWLPYDTLMYSVPFFTLFGIILVWGLEPLRLEFLR